jgi:hypothetical protein
MLVSSRYGSSNSTSHILPAADAPISPGLKRDLIVNARHAGVRLTTLKEVAGIGGISSRIGILVGSDAKGRDYLSPFTTKSFVAFTPVSDAVSNSRPFALVTTSEPDNDGRVGKVNVLGVASPRIERVVLDLASGKRFEITLVIAGRLKYSYFSYTCTEKGGFPTIVHGYGAGRSEVTTRDLSWASKPPPLHG